MRLTDKCGWFVLALALMDWCPTWLRMAEIWIAYAILLLPDLIRDSIRLIPPCSAASPGGALMARV